MAPKRKGQEPGEAVMKVGKARSITGSSSEQPRAAIDFEGSGEEQRLQRYWRPRTAARGDVKARTTRRAVDGGRSRTSSSGGRESAELSADRRAATRISGGAQEAAQAAAPTRRLQQRRRGSRSGAGEVAAAVTVAAAR
ncbi:hypothetical protein Scep_004291 [Stephania cephalantha]|uniref:Uncharacterized protein n=1 Tax=Stephania cephalantha TaxID=152367 RepID=A0AAP0PV89_9MAGN